MLVNMMQIEDSVRQAIDGNKDSLENIIMLIQDDVYYLALRMLANPEHAKDATQEILIKVITKLSTFRFESQFKTWVYSVATHYLLTEKKVLDKDPGLNFDIYKADLESDLSEPGSLKEQPEYQVLLNELRISCTMAMVLCLKPSYRMAYILGDILELDHNEASEAMSISKDNFRKQLSRARYDMVNFISTSCGLSNGCAKCRCEKKITTAINRDRVNPEQIYFAQGNQDSYADIKKRLRETRQNLQALTLQKSIKFYKCPIKLADTIESIVNDAIDNSSY